MTFQHNQTKGLLHVHPDGQTLNKHGEPISPAKALESALSPQAEKSNGIEKSKDAGPGFGM